MITSTSGDWYVLRTQAAKAVGRPVEKGFLVRKGSTAMREGSPNVKRDREQRDQLMAKGILLVDDTDPALLRFTCDHVFGSPSQAGGVIKDGNCSGPKSWHRESDGKTLKDLS